MCRSQKTSIHPPGDYQVSSSTYGSNLDSLHTLVAERSVKSKPQKFSATSYFPLYVTISRLLLLFQSHLKPVVDATGALVQAFTICKFSSALPSQRQLSSLPSIKHITKNVKRILCGFVFECKLKFGFDTTFIFTKRAQQSSLSV